MLRERAIFRREFDGTCFSPHMVDRLTAKIVVMAMGRSNGDIALIFNGDGSGCQEWVFDSEPGELPMQFESRVKYHEQL